MQYQLLEIPGGQENVKDLLDSSDVSAKVLDSISADTQNQTSHTQGTSTPDHWGGGLSLGKAAVLKPD